MRASTKRSVLDLFVISYYAKAFHIGKSGIFSLTYLLLNNIIYLNPNLIPLQVFIKLDHFIRTLYGAQMTLCRYTKKEDVNESELKKQVWSKYKCFLVVLLACRIITCLVSVTIALTVPL